MRPELYIAHQTDGRTRLRLAQRATGDRRREQLIALKTLAEELTEALPDPYGLLRTDARPETGSLIVDHPGLQGEALLRALEALDCPPVERPDSPARPGLSPLLSGIGVVDRSIRDSSSGSADLRTLIFVLLLGLAIAQLLRGQVMAPAASLLWYAFDLALRGSENA
jgi:hypothetical protein